jgi:hypothetical protein
MSVCIKLVFVSDRFVQLSLMWTRPRAYFWAEHLKNSSLGQAEALLANIKLSRKGLPETNTVAYYEHL